MATPSSAEQVSVACIYNPERKRAPPVFRATLGRSRGAHASRAPGSLSCPLREPPQVRALASLLSPAGLGQPGAELPPRWAPAPASGATEATGCTAPASTTRGLGDTRAPGAARTNAGRAPLGRSRAVFTRCQDTGPGAQPSGGAGLAPRVPEPAPAFQFQGARSPARPGPASLARWRRGLQVPDPARCGPTGCGRPGRRRRPRGPDQARDRQGARQGGAGVCMVLVLVWVDSGVSLSLATHWLTLEKSPETPRPPGK